MTYSPLIIIVQYIHIFYCTAYCVCKYLNKIIHFSRFGEKNAVGWATVMQRKETVQYPEVILGKESEFCFHDQIFKYHYSIV